MAPPPLADTFLRKMQPVKLAAEWQVTAPPRGDPFRSKWQSEIATAAPVM